MVFSRKYKPSYAKELMAIAYDDLKAAEILKDAKFKTRPEIVGFHAQQSVEKALKALACASGKSIVYTHDLVALIAHLEPEIKFPWADKLTVLSPFAMNRRYEEGAEVLEQDDLDALVDLARTFYEWALPEIEKRVGT